MARDQGGEPDERRGRVTVAVAATVVLCGVVAIASRSWDPASSGATDQVTGPGSTPDLRVGISIALVVLVTVMVSPLILLVLSALRHLLVEDPSVPDDSLDSSAFDVVVPTWVRRVVVGIVILGAVALMALFYLGVQALFPSAGAGGQAGGEAGGGRASRGSVVYEPAGSSAVRLPTNAELWAIPGVRTLILAAGVLLVMVTVIAVARRRDALDQPVGPTAPIVGGNASSPDRDPFAFDVAGLGAGGARAGIERCFAVAEELLTTAGFGPGWSETAAEHVARVGPALPGPAGLALDRLSGLFHEAKFSTHPIDEAQRADAVDATVVLRDTLGPVPSLADRRRP